MVDKRKLSDPLSIVEDVFEGGTGQRLRDLHREITTLQAEFAQTLGTFDAEQGYEREHYGSTRSWLQGELRMSANEASQQVCVARQVKFVPVVEKAFADAEITFNHVAMIARTVAKVGTEAIALVEHDLAQAARVLDAGRFRRVTDRVEYWVNPDGKNREAKRNYDRRTMSAHETFDGMIAIHGLLDPASGEMAQQALNSLMPPPGEGDTRTTGQRRADAFVELCRRQLDGGELPTRHGEKPHVAITLSYETLVKQTGCGPADFAWTGPVPAEVARRFACDADLIPIVLGSDSEVLDIGRKSRVFTAAMRRAIIQRDGHCQFLGCTAPSEHCDIHHVVFWADGGSTSVDNGKLQCGYHHMVIHLNEDRVIVLPNGKITIDRSRSP